MASTTSQPAVTKSHAPTNSKDVNGGAIAGDSMQEPVQATNLVNVHGYGGGSGPLPPSFSYGVFPNVDHPSGTSQESSLYPAVNSMLGSSAMPRPAVPGLSNNVSPSFSYKISHGGVGFFGDQQFPSGMRCAQDFRALLAEVVTAETATQEKEDGKTVFNSWSTAKHLLKADPRYTKMPRKDRESLWRWHVEDVQRRQRRHELGSDQEAEKHNDGRVRISVESGKYLSGSRYSL